MCHLFLGHCNGISLFLPLYTEISPDIHLYTDADDLGPPLGLSTVTTRLSLLFCLPRAPKFPVWWTLYGWSLFKHLVLILHLLLSMSPGLIMSLLSILFPDTCHRSAFLHQTYCHLPAVRSLNFWPKFNHASCLLLLPSVLLPLLVALTHPRSTSFVSQWGTLSRLGLVEHNFNLFRSRLHS